MLKRNVNTRDERQMRKEQVRNVFKEKPWRCDDLDKSTRKPELKRSSMEHRTTQFKADISFRLRDLVFHCVHIASEINTSMLLLNMFY